MKQTSNTKGTDPEWKDLYRIGGAAALLAGILFRRNIAAEIGLFSEQASPATVSDWFTLLQQNRLLALSYLHIFDVVNYVLLALMFLALYAALRHISKSYMIIATALGFLGIAIYLASNTAFSILSLSDLYAAAITDEQRRLLLAAGQALLAINRFTTGANPGSTGYLSLLLIALAGLITSLVMLRSNLFNRATAYIGLLATALDLAYCSAYAFVPSIGTDRLAIYFIPAAGLFLMIWHILIGWRLYQLGRESRSIAA
jgi:hypothetical protein